jgi:MtN3 and saliva related transmembrane protein
MDIAWIGLLAGTLTTAGFMPQLIKSIRTKKVDDVSLFQPVVLLTGMAFWISYGFLLNDLAIILANVISFILNAWLIIIKYKYQYKIAGDHNES